MFLVPGFGLSFLPLLLGDVTLTFACLSWLEAVALRSEAVALRSEAVALRSEAPFVVIVINLLLLTSVIAVPPNGGPST